MEFIRMDMVFNVLTVLEIISVEFIAIWTLSRKKHSLFLSLGLYVAITLLLMLFMVFVAVRLPDYGNGNGRLMVLGVLYFIPALVNYAGDVKSRIIIAFYSFSYGLAGFAMAVRIGYLFDESYLAGTVLAAQTLLYALTFPMYLRFSKHQFISYIQKAGKRQKNLLIRYTIVSFLLIIAYNNTMVMDVSMLRKLFVYMLLLCFIILSYSLCVSYLRADDDNQELSELTRIDRLTQLGNRIALRSSLDMMASEKGTFYLIFLDLDDFKSINDRYGHASGDRYLRAFSDMLRECSEEEDQFFRFAGDEFIGLTCDAMLYKKIEELNTGKVRIDEMDFLGVSVGMAKYPDEAESISELLELSDKRMYEFKRDRD
ncbi:GGDEF domain-containing protein [Dorea sp. D27]|uniref:GGDEF domain-containing protein n=1 Tax=Dorea sp. D27 TaxID=658665 RepID=UPI0006739E11|nr:GGDEF domain-containing protein [Dorea sp. D27]KMZ54620.1 signaling repeat/GGDEF domain/EAL domain protein [Dorea sp. D27]